MSRPRSKRPDMIVVSHGPDECILTPLTARADRFLDRTFLAEPDPEVGWKVPWPDLREVVRAIHAARLTVEE